MPLKKAKELYQKHQRWAPIAFFALGFLFDALVLHRPDEPMVLIQQAIYIVVSCIMISYEFFDTQPRFLERFWKYRESFLHFLLGTLLNSYTIFYFKSSSAFTSFFFIAALIALLMLNEFKRFGKSQTQVHVALLSLCVISYLVSLTPILLGFIGIVPFLVANAAALVLFFIYRAIMRPKLAANPKIFRTHVLAPFAIVQITFALLYFARVIPPVPLSTTYMGIFHSVAKSEGKYALTYTRPVWKFWQHGDQTFLARPGDEVFCFVQVYSPSRFKDKLQVRWLNWQGKRGWQHADAIPMDIVGGREEGYRGITKKSNYQAGLWRVQIETTDGREVGRINFKIQTDDSTEDRTMGTVVF